jgi:hypothetical protein
MRKLTGNGVEIIGLFKIIATRGNKTTTIGLVTMSTRPRWHLLHIIIPSEVEGLPFSVEQTAEKYNP